MHILSKQPLTVLKISIQIVGTSKGGGSSPIPESISTVPQLPGDLAGKSTKFSGNRSPGHAATPPGDSSSGIS
jgi:hypothetical protein